MKQFKYSTIVFFCAFLTACSQTQINLDSHIETPLAFEQAGSQKSASEIQHWWQNWHDPQLNRLIEQALANNLDIALAKSRLNEAQALGRLAEADKGINVGASGSMGSGISKLESGSPLLSSQTGKSLNGYGGIKVSWEADFFGQKQSDVDAANAVILGQQQQVYATQMLVTTQVADHYFRFQTTEQLGKLLLAQQQQLEKLQRYVKGRFEAGQATSYESDEISRQITALKAQQATIKAQADSEQRTIAVLLGQTPQGFRLTATAMKNLPAIPTGQLPSEVLARRPDIQANLAQIQRYSAQLASAKADLLPRFSLNFLGQGGHLKLDNDLSHLSGLGSLISADIQLPIFTNGRLQANIDAADSRLKGALIQYDKSLLNTLSEVDNAYQLQSSLNQQVALLRKKQQQSQKQASNTLKLFELGEKTLDLAIQAKINAIGDEQQLLQARLAQTQNMIGLFKALGGGWL